MDGYDIFVLVVAAVVFYFLYRIFAPVIRGLIRTIKSAKGMVDKHRARKAQEQAYAEDPQQDAEEECAVEEDPEAVEKLLGNPLLQHGIAGLIIHYNKKIWEYLGNNYDTEGKGGFRTLIASSLLLQVTEQFGLGNNEEVINALNSSMCDQDKSYSMGALRLGWPNIWKIFMEYKPTEDEPGKAASMVLVRTIMPVAGSGSNTELYEFVGTALRYLDEQCEELWENA